MTFPALFGAALLAATAVLPDLARAQQPQEVTVKMTVLPGLKFDQPRFAVPPGAKVTIVFTNPDQMIHNFVITAPGARLDVVQAALALGAAGPAKNFVPDSDKVLYASKALSPGETTNLTFTAPREEQVYPYVCTYTGHGFVMYGAMYVTSLPLPDLANDPHVPPAGVAAADGSDHSHHALDRPRVSRTFLPDCGPAALAIGFPGGQSYCFDAGSCRLRYAWSGGFVDNTEHWAGKGEVMGKPVGHVYYRAPASFPIRLGAEERIPKAQWQGYTIVKGVPILRYHVDGVNVREFATPQENGLSFTYEVDATTPVYFITEPASGATFTSSAGSWKEGVLTLTAAEAKHFTITLQERPGIEPTVYWSMNDAPLPGATLPLPGVIGRAFTPGGFGPKPKALELGLGTAAIKQLGTLMAWVKQTTPIAPPKKKPMPTTNAVFSAENAEKTFKVEAPADLDRWHHLATVFTPTTVVCYVDGQADAHTVVERPEFDAPILIGSIGEKQFFSGLIDEVRAYDRALDADEIAQIFRREKAALDSPSPARP